MKITNGSAGAILTRRKELEVTIERQEDCRIYRVYPFATSPKIFTPAPPLNCVLQLRPELWRASR